MRYAWIIGLKQALLLLAVLMPVADAGSEERVSSESAYMSYVSPEFPRWNLLGPNRNDQSVTPTESGSPRILPILSSLLPVSEHHSLYGDMGGSFFFTAPSLVFAKAEVKLNNGLLTFHPMAPLRYKESPDQWRRWITIDPMPIYNTAIPIDQWQYMDGYLHLPEFNSPHRRY